jgi:hypothetical protein
MKKLFLSFLILIFAHVSPAQTEVYFDNNSHKLTPKGERALSVLINATQTNGGIFHLIGHADTVGTEISNLQLSKKRVDKVRAYLIDKGISNSEIYTDYKGESVATKLNQRDNRKVEIIIRPSMEAAKHLDKLQDKFRPKTQNFSFSTESMCTLKGEKGTEITIEPNSLILPNGDLAIGKIDYELTEYYDMASFFSEQLYTMSNEKLIESGGMIRIEAYSNGEPLSLAEGKEIEIQLSDKRWGTNGFQTFYGNRLPNGAMNWETETEENPLAMLTLNMGLRGHIIIKEDGSMDTLPDSITVDTTFYEVSNEMENITNVLNIINSSKLGFINCDRFYNKPTKEVQLAVRIKNPDIQPISSYLVLAGMNSVLPVSYNYNKKYFANTFRLPRMKNIKLVILGYNVKTKQNCLYEEVLQVSSSIRRIIDLKAVTAEQIKQVFN